MKTVLPFSSPLPHYFFSSPLECISRKKKLVNFPYKESKTGLHGGPKLLSASLFYIFFETRQQKKGYNGKFLGGKCDE